MQDHNLNYNYFKPQFKLSDYDFAKQYSSGRTKTTSIINEMADDHQKSVIKVLQNFEFSLAIDGSNNMDTKLYPVVVTYFDEEVNHIKSLSL